MRAYGKIKLGFYPLPLPEARRLKNCLVFPPEFSAIDPCVGDGVTFMHLLEGTQARLYGIEIDAYRVEQAARLGIDTLQANTMDVRCPSATVMRLSSTTTGLPASELTTQPRYGPERGTR